MPLFSGRWPDLAKMALGLAIYALFFFGYGHLNKWLYIPLDVIVVGGGESRSHPPYVADTGPEARIKGQ
jgi:hypothetical protein